VCRGRGGRLDVTNELREGGTVDQIDRFAGGEGMGVVCERAGCDEDAARGIGSRDHAEELADFVDADTAGAPLFALNEDSFAVAVEFEIDTAVRTAAPCLFDVVAASAIGFADEMLEFAPGERAKGVDAALAVE